MPKDSQKLSKIHFVCMGCRKVSNEQIRCTTSGCPRNRNPYSKCECTDELHSKIPYLDAAGYAIKNTEPTPTESN